MDLVTVLISTLAFGLAFTSFWVTRPAAVLKRDQVKGLTAIAAQGLVFLEQVKTIASSEVHGIDPDPYMLPSLRANAELLWQQIENALALGLWVQLVGTGKSALAYHTALIQSLASAAAPSSDFDDFTKEHLIMGITRLLAKCHKSTMLSKQFAPIVAEYLPAQPLVERSHAYLEA